VAVVMEGLLMYLDQQEVGSLLAQVLTCTVGWLMHQALLDGYWW
jgi:O-methyltransferase involved in polyketide biosynthesis